MNKAAGENSLSIATISQKIASLESALGYPIFERTTRRTMLTPAGQDLVARIEPSVQAFKRSLPNFGSRAFEGRTKITCAVSNSLTVPVLEAAAGFLQSHPEIDFEIIDNQYYFRDRLLPIDISVFANLAHHERDENQILGVEPTYFLASPKLIDEAGSFETPEDLRRVRLLMCSNWTCPKPFYQHASRPGRELLHAENAIFFISPGTLIAACRQHLGAVWAVPTLMAESEIAAGRLVRILHDREGPSIRYFLGTSRLAASGIKREFAALLGQKLSRELSRFRTTAPSFALY